MASSIFYTKTQIARLTLKDLQDALEDHGLDTSGGVWGSNRDFAKLFTQLALVSLALVSQM